MNDKLLRQVAARGKYGPLYRHLIALDVPQWRATFRVIESILGFDLPNSARVHRPWWANQANGGHSHALAWHAAGWRTTAVNLAAEVLVFERVADAAAPRQSVGRDISIQELFPPHDFGNWPEGFSASREQIYGEDGR